MAARTYIASSVIWRRRSRGWETARHGLEAEGRPSAKCAAGRLFGASSAARATSATVRSSARRRSPARDPTVSQTSPPARRGWQLPCTTTYKASVRINHLGAGEDRVADAALEAVLQHEVYRAGKQVR